MAASGNPGVPLLDQGVSSLLAMSDQGESMSGGLLGELCMVDSPGVSNIGFDKSSSISSIMLGPVTTWMGTLCNGVQGRNLVLITVEGQLLESHLEWFWGELSAVECPHC